MDHAAIIHPFLSSRGRARFDNIDPGSKKRANLLHRPCHHYERELDWRLAQAIPPAEQTNDSIASRLRRFGASRTCYALCLYDEWDGQYSDLRAALDALVGHGFAFMLISSESLAYFEPEYSLGAGRRFVLQRRGSR